MHVLFGPTSKGDTISVRGARSDLWLAPMEWARVGAMYRWQVAAHLRVRRLLLPVRGCLCRLAARARHGAGCRVVGDHEVVQVQFVGSNDAFGSGGRGQTCIRLAASGKTLLVDCGATSLVALKAQRIDPNTIDAVVVTHLHGDHFGGLPYLARRRVTGRGW